MPLSRIQLIRASGIKSSYKKTDGTYYDVSDLKNSCFLTPDANDALHNLDTAVTKAGGSLFVTELYRSWANQAQANQDYVNHKRTAFASPAGESFHQAGRAIDIDLDKLNFNCSSDMQLSKFWNVAIPLGWQPIISKPDSAKSESWHFQFVGKEWSRLYQKASDALVAQCCILDVGQWSNEEAESKTLTRFIQAQCNRLLQYENNTYLLCDGICGPKTKAAVLSLTKDADPVNALCVMETPKKAS